MSVYDVFLRAKKDPVRMLFDACQICGDVNVVKLPPDWQLQVLDDNRYITIVGCGNPWHYIFPEGEKT
jgi:hypothetical protein